MGEDSDDVDMEAGTGAETSCDVYYAFEGEALPRVVADKASLYVERAAAGGLRVRALGNVFSTTKSTGSSR